MLQIAADYRAVESITHQSSYYLELFPINFHCAVTSQPHWGRTSTLLNNLATSCFKAHTEKSAIFKVHRDKLRKLLVAYQTIRIPVIIGQPDCPGVEESQSQHYPNPLTHTKGEILTHTHFILIHP